MGRLLRLLHMGSILVWYDSETLLSSTLQQAPSFSRGAGRKILTMASSLCPQE